MGHAPPTRRAPRHPPAPLPSPPAQRFESDYALDYALGYAQRAYVSGEIDVFEFEEAVEHVLRGGLGNERFPYLPAFVSCAMEEVNW